MRVFDKTQTFTSIVSLIETISNKKYSLFTQNKNAIYLLYQHYILYHRGQGSLRWHLASLCVSSIYRTIERMCVCVAVYLCVSSVCFVLCV